jgi:pyruvate/2-oxoglutarate dehydrogenase complex dihydrolipoamide acyltransferase (E2) component
MSPSKGDSSPSGEVCSPVGDERGQVLSSLVAVLAVVAIVGGLLVLFGTRGNSSAADSQPVSAQKSSPKPSASSSTTSAPITAEPSSTPTSDLPSGPTSEATSAPTSVPSSAPTSGPTSAPSASIPPSERPAVEVYNNTARKGLAEDVAIRARQVGWTVAGADNWHGKIVTSTVYFPAGMQAEAAQLAKDIGVDRIKDALDTMKKDRLTVILTSDYTG